MTHPTDPTPDLAPSAPHASAESPLPQAAPVTSFSGLWQSDLREAAARQASWLWHGYLAPGNVTLLTSQWKSGKTTLVAVLLARLKAGGQLAGLPVWPGKAVVISEESPLHWYRRDQKLHFGDHVCWLCRPFAHRPRPEEWSALVDHLATLREQHGIDLVVIDPLASFLPARTENIAGAMLDALLPLQRLTRRGVCVLVLHHPRKGEVKAGQAARGSGALAGHVDIVLEMTWYGRPSDPDRRRRIEAYSRHEETPRRLVIELTADGTDYLAHGDLGEDTSDESREVLRGVLAAAGRPLTRREILARWPRGALPAPDAVTLWRWLERLVGEGEVSRDGSGRRNRPYRYGLALLEDRDGQDKR
jgi:hypothetical protein